MSRPSALQLDGVSRRFRRTTALDHIDLRIEHGEIVGLIGPNGAGKSTAVEILAGLRRPTTGTARVMGLDPMAERSRVRSVLGVQLQEPALHDALTVVELIRLHASFHRHPLDPEKLLRDLRLHEHRRLRVGHLSGGQAQRLSIAAALVGGPRVMILDELTTGLDPQARRMVWQVIEEQRARDVAVLLVSHQMDELERLCDRLVLLEAGRIRAQGTVAQICAEAGEARSLEEAFLALIGEPEFEEAS